MNNDVENIINIASAELMEVAKSWMPASSIRPFMVNDPGQIWLEKFGWKHGFLPDPVSTYDYLNFQFSQDDSFRKKWRDKYARNCPQVCQEAYHVRYQYRLEQTLRLMTDVKTRIIYQPALWWAPDSVYGTPDFIVRTSWLKGQFGKAYKELEDNLGSGAVPDHFVILEIRFSKSSADPTEKANHILVNQLRLHNHMLSQLQGWAAPCAFLVTRADPGTLIPIKMSGKVGSSLESDLKQYQNSFRKIIEDGDTITPWENPQVEFRFEPGR